MLRLARNRRRQRVVETVLREKNALMRGAAALAILFCRVSNRAPLHAVALVREDRYAWNLLVVAAAQLLDSDLDRS